MLPPEQTWDPPICLRRAVCCLPTSCSLRGLCPLGMHWQWLSMHACVSLFLVCAHDQPNPHVKYTRMGLSEQLLFLGYGSCGSSTAWNLGRSQEQALTLGKIIHAPPFRKREMQWMFQVLGNGLQPTTFPYSSPFPKSEGKEGSGWLRIWMVTWKPWRE